MMSLHNNRNPNEDTFIHDTNYYISCQHILNFKLFYLDLCFQWKDSRIQQYLKETTGKSLNVTIFCKAADSLFQKSGWNPSLKNSPVEEAINRACRPEMQKLRKWSKPQEVGNLETHGMTHWARHISFILLGNRLEDLCQLPWEEKQCLQSTESGRWLTGDGANAEWTRPEEETGREFYSWYQEKRGISVTHTRVPTPKTLSLISLMSRTPEAENWMNMMLQKAM